MDTNWSRLQRSQNSALGIYNGCHEMADVAELHPEARELPVIQNNELISQFSIAYHLPQHVCHRQPDDRPDRRRSLIGRIKPNIKQYLTEEPLSNTSYKSAISSSTKMRSELPLKAAHIDCIMADCRPL